jgi:hypothetical protein
MGWRDTTMDKRYMEIIGNFHIEIERPLKLRVYERDWEFDRSIVRYSLQGQAGLGKQQFAQLLRMIQEEYGPLLMEADEVYESTDYVKALIKKEFFAMDPTTEVDPRKRSSALLEDGVINYYNTSYSCIIETNCIEYMLTHLDVMEWWGSYWNAKYPYSLLGEAIANGQDRVEPVMLASIEDCSPVFFFAPNHHHLELMARDSQARLLLDILREIGRQ